MKEPRTHYQEAFGHATPCGIVPSYRRPTKVIHTWLGVDCAECLAVNAPKKPIFQSYFGDTNVTYSRYRKGAEPTRTFVGKQSTHSFRTNHPRWPETLDAVRKFMDRYGRERAKNLVSKYVRPRNAATRVSNVPICFWPRMRDEIEHWLAKPAVREAAWGDLYFWRRDRPNRSWQWVQGRETSQSKFHGHTPDMQGDRQHGRLTVANLFDHGQKGPTGTRGGLPGRLSDLQNEYSTRRWFGTDYADLWKSCSTQWKYHGTSTGRWTGKDPALATPYSGKLAENLIQGNIYNQMAPRITGNRADLLIIDDHVAPQAATDIMRQMDKAWRAATMYGGKPDMIWCGDAFLKAYRKDVESARVLEHVLNFNYKEVEARVKAAFKDALLYGSAGYTIPHAYKIDNSETPATKENTVSNGNVYGNPFARHFGFNPAEFVPARHGQPWDYESDARLIRFLKGGFDVSEIAAELQRSEVSIECRITFLAYKEERATLLAAGIAKLTAEPKTPRAKRKSKAKAKAKKSRK